jgi:hypothetical protein
MKKTLAIVGLGVATAVASARTPYAGASVGYLLDSKEEYLSARVGVDIAETAKVRHSIEAEIGNTSETDQWGSRLSITPITLNYRATFECSDNFTLSSGIGLGASVVDLRIEGWVYSSWVGFSSIEDFNSYGGNYWYRTASDRDIALTGQAFVGADLKLTRSLSVTAAARYIWVNDAELFGWKERVGDDIALEIGVSWKF